MRRGGFIWGPDTLTPNLATFVVKANFAIRAGAVRMANDMEQWARDNAPWNDRTGDARAGLEAEAEHMGFRQEITIHHTVEYGIWLEVRWNGRYAIIGPTVEHFAQQQQEYFGTEIMAAGAL